MRLMVRRENSPLTASNPRAMATSGIRNPMKDAKDGSGSRATVISLRNRKLSSALVLLRLSIAPQAEPIAVSSTSAITRCMRALVIWSAASLSAMVHVPLKGEPSRRMALLPEIAVIGFAKPDTMGVERNQAAAVFDDFGRKFGPHVAGRKDAPATGISVHAIDAFDAGEQGGGIGKLGFEIDFHRLVADSARQFLDRTDKADPSGIEQRQSGTDGPDHIEQARGHKNRHALAREIGDEAQKLLGRLRVEPRGRFVEDSDPGLAHQQFGQPEPLAHAAREGRHALIGNAVKADPGECPCDPLAGLAGRQ